MKETFKEANYRYVGSIQYTGRGKMGHVLRDLDTLNEELWYSNKNHAGYGLIYKNTHLKFACTLKNWRQ